MLLIKVRLALQRIKPSSQTSPAICPQMSEKPSPTPETPKHIVCTHWWHFLAWHSWTVASLTVTATLLWLNFTEYAIGGEIGRSPKSSADILGALQLAIKTHELLIVASLITIARQMIIGDLLDGGIVLGLLGAEASFSTPSFVLTGEFTQSFLFGLRSIYKSDSQPINRRMLWLASFVFWACVLSSLAGPASGVLMIPRIDWHPAGTIQYSPPLNSTVPNVIIGAAGGFEYSVSQMPGLKYWQYYFENADWNETNAAEDDQFHKFGDVGTVAYINTTGSYGRILDAKWDNGTNITCEMHADSAERYGNTWAKFRTPMNGTITGWKAVKSTINVVALKAVVTCRARERIPCSATSTLSGNYEDPDWCYMSVGYFASSSVLRTSRNLLLAADHRDYYPRVWVTEGPKIEANSHYSDSIEVIFETPPPSNEMEYYDDSTPTFNLTVCSFSGALASGIGTALGTHATAEKVEYFDYALKPDGRRMGPRRILFHENWLDNAYSRKDSPWESDNDPDTDALASFTYPARPRTTVSPYNVLAAFGNATQVAGEFSNVTEALPSEVAVGGALAYLLSWTSGSDTQYAIPLDEIPRQFTDGLGPPESWPIDYVFKVYQEGYIFRLSTRTGYLGVMVLGLHGITAIVASLWQLFVTRRVILGWTNTPEYIMLGAGSPSLTTAYPNTCAGIAAKGALSGVIILKETSSNPSPPDPSHLTLFPADISKAPIAQASADSARHLEIVAGNPGDPDRGTKVDVKATSRKYGFNGARKRSGSI